MRATHALTLLLFVEVKSLHADRDKTDGIKDAYTDKINDSILICLPRKSYFFFLPQWKALVK